MLQTTFILLEHACIASDKGNEAFTLIGPFYFPPQLIVIKPDLTIDVFMQSMFLILSFQMDGNQFALRDP